MSAHTFTLAASNAAGSAQASASVTVADPPPTGEVITINPAVKFQTMAPGCWEAHARAWVVNKVANNYDASWKVNAPAIAQALVNLGINRLQVPLRSGWLNPTDYWSQFVAGTLSYTAWKVFNYEKIGTAIYWSEFDFIADTMIVPISAALAARGEKLYVNMDVVDFNTAGYNQGSVSLANSPAAYANFVLACFDRLKTKYGITADALELLNEPVNTAWNGTQMGNALVAVRAKLTAAGYANVKYIGPSAARTYEVRPWVDPLLAVPGAKLDVLAYHRYNGPAASAVAALDTFAKSKGLTTDMSEWIDATSDTLIEDLLVGNVSSWQKWAIAGRTGMGGNPQSFYVSCEISTTPPTITLAPNTPKMAAITRYVRGGATRIAATSGNAAHTLVAFVNANGKHVVIVKSATADMVTISGLLPGAYGVHRIDTSDVASDLPDVTVAGNLAITVNPGLTTIYAR